MPKHQLDPLALSAGLIFLAVAVVAGAGGAHLLTARGVLPAILVILGLTGMLSGWLSHRRSAAVRGTDQQTLGERAAAGRRERGDA